MQLLKDYALKFVGTPYKWGGANPIEGLDCSGFVQLILAAAGIDPPGDQTAQGLFNHFEKTASHGIRKLGSLAFFGKSVTQISHIGWCLDPYRMIHASGGDHLTLTLSDAARKNAYVKVTLIEYRPDLVAVLKPQYMTIGVI
jgi:cell wall-associated NlpC family hydrolase